MMTSNGPLLATAGEDVLAVTVVERRHLAAQVIGLTFERADGGVFPSWSPGAHVDLILDSGLTRQYSLAGRPEERHRLSIAVQREVESRGASVAVHETLRVSSRVRLRGPRNHFELVDSDRYLLVAGGIGVVPLLPMVREMQASGRDWQLLYGGRSRASMAFVDDLLEIDRDRVLIRPQDEFGLLDLDRFLGSPPAGTHVYCCGPAPLLDAIESQAATWTSGTQLHVERFDPKVDLDQLAQTDRAVHITLVRSGIELDVPPTVSILDKVREAGVNILSSCQEGTCGTCEVRVLGGRPDHRDSVLTDEEQDSNEYMLICVSRALTPDLELDL